MEDCLAHQFLNQLVQLCTRANLVSCVYQWRDREGNFSTNLETAFLTEGFGCLGEGDIICDGIYDAFLRDGKSVHLAPYRLRISGYDYRDYEPLICWADVDDICIGDYRGVSFWPSRQDGSRGVKIGLVTIPEECDARSLWKHFADVYGGDHAAAKPTHSFRLPGWSAVKDGIGLSKAWYEEKFSAFYQSWKTRAVLTTDLHVPHVGNGIKPAAREVQRRCISVLSRAILEEIQSKWKAGQRHGAALAFAGIMRKAGLSVEDAKALMADMAKSCNDNQISDRIKAVETTYEQDEDKIAGQSILRSLG